jgi:hypothetical protein
MKKISIELAKEIMKSSEACLVFAAGEMVATIASCEKSHTYRENNEEVETFMSLDVNIDEYLGFHYYFLEQDNLEVVIDDQGCLLFSELEGSIVKVVPLCRFQLN